ncbi:MAG: D-Ala-D-Ala carboxypeptidase family metallohydrolase [Luteolibacter sp.]
MFFPNEPATTATLESVATDRRRVIGSLGLAGLGLLASSISGQAKTYVVRESSRPKVNVQTSSQPLPRLVGAADLTQLPPEWAHNQGSVLPEYTRYLTSLRLQRVCAKQVIEAHAKAKGSVWNILPPKVWWARMAYTLRVADRIALEMGASEVEIVSAYRCPAYNSHCEGAKYGSWHQANVAVDVKFPMAPSLVTATARQLRDLGLFRGGVGGYSDFTHIDSRGQNVNWQG